MKCFVVMGFGKKTDYQSSPPRVIDLDKTYHNIVKPAVVEAGFECIRADEIIHSTVIDKPMYEHLREADLVIADLSTSNANAIYELGVRHALRPHATIVMAEDKFAFPFDLNHLSIMKYEHLGSDIGFSEVMRVRGLLTGKIQAVRDQTTDSPVFLFLPQLLEALGGASRTGAPPVPAPVEAPMDPESKSVEQLAQMVRAARKAAKTPEGWIAVVTLLKRLRNLQPNDPCLLQQLAVATYKAKQPDEATALREAQKTLAVLAPETSCDAETVGVWGAIHKRLWDLGKSPADLAVAVRAYARGYFIKNDHYNGINFAFLLDVRAANSNGDDAIADRVMARRIRREVLAICDDLIKAGLSQPIGGPATGQDPALLAKQQRDHGEDMFWVSATRLESLVGLGRAGEAEAQMAAIAALNPPPDSWMLDTLTQQIAKLEALLK